MVDTKFKLIRAIRIYLNDMFNLHEDSEREELTISEIKKGVVFRGANLWILIFAILIASVGLNVNSTAVIIGAMLISPLMGPIMGIGLGAGINDLELIKKGFKNLSEAVLISVLTSALYFWITPLYEAQSELLARTTPTLWDVLIALFGGLAGIIAVSRKEKSNAIPGVAIATALMPPLCTAGYGLAIGNWYFFIGAFYLFFINSVFISVSTFLIVRFLGYKKVTFEDTKTEIKVRRIISVFVVVTILPSVYFAYNLVKNSIFEQNARTYISIEFELENTQVINQEFIKKNDERIIEVTLFGKMLSDTKIKELIDRKKMYNLQEATVKVIQGTSEEESNNIARQEIQRMGESLKVGLIEDLYKKNEAALANKEQQINLLENELRKLGQKQYPLADILAELKIQYPQVKSLAMGDLINQQQDTICHAFITFNRKISTTDQRKVKEWLLIRSKADTLVVVIQ